MFGSIDIKSRPLRLAYLVEPGNTDQIRRAIQLSSTLWGGSTFPIIPLWTRIPKRWNEKPLKSPSAKRVIQGYVAAFDPDVIVQLSSTVPDYVTATGRQVIAADEIWRDLEGRRGGLPRFGIGIFEILQDVFEKHFRYKAKYPVRVAIPTIPKEFSLFWSATFGELPPNIEQALNKGKFHEALDIETPAFAAEQLSEMVNGDVLFPRRLTQHELTFRNRANFGRDATVFFMDAKDAADIVDYWNLRALGRTVVAVPKQLKDHPQFIEVVTTFLSQSRRPWPHDPTVFDVASIIRSRKVTMEEMQAWAKSLTFVKDANEPQVHSSYLLQQWYPRIWDEWARSKDGAEPADAYGREESIEIGETSERMVRFKPILPQFANEYGPTGEPRCANEVSFRLYGETEFLAEVFPNTNGDNVARAIGGLASFKGDWRVGRHGLVNLVKDAFSESRDIPAAQDVMFAWLADLGWKAQLSTAGLLAAQIHRHLEGHPEYILRNEKLLGLLEHMNGGSVRQDGSPKAENKISAERAIPVADVKNRLGDERLYDYLITKGVFRLGVSLQCPHCRRKAWFALDAIRDLFTCPRCLRAFPATGNLDAGTWSYKTAGPFSVPGYADGAYAVLLTATFLEDRRMVTMRSTRLLSFEAVAGNKTLEADVASLWSDTYYTERNEGLLFAESKTYDQFKRKDFDRMRHLAKTFPGAVLVFSTLRTSLTPKEIAAITGIAKTGRRYWKAERSINPVLILTGTELLSNFRPPDCWNDPTKTRFNHFPGLLGLCDATQQIYLGLPPWENELREKFEKRRRRRIAKQESAREDAIPPVS